jgi:hypothetical protein
MASERSLPKNFITFTQKTASCAEAQLADAFSSHVNADY